MLSAQPPVTVFDKKAARLCAVRWGVRKFIHHRIPAREKSKMANGM